MSNQTQRHRGVIVPMATPFTENGSLDEDGARRIIDFLIDGGVDGVFVLGTTGEAASIPAPMRARLVEITVDQVRGRSLVYAGIGDNCVSRSLEAGAEYHTAGVDAVVAHVASYYPIGPEEIESYFTRLADQLPGPVILYNIPSTTHHSIPIDVIGKLCDHPNVAGLKDSERNEERLRAITGQFAGRGDFSLQVGVTAHALLGLELGAVGFVPSSGNLDPVSCHEAYESMNRGDLESAQRAQDKMDAVGNFCQPGCPLGGSLAILKAAMSLKGLCGPHMLPPLLTKSAEGIAALRPAMEDLGIL